MQYLCINCSFNEMCLSFFLYFTLFFNKTYFKKSLTDIVFALCNGKPFFISRYAKYNMADNNLRLTNHYYLINLDKIKCKINIIFQLINKGFQTLNSKQNKE